VFYRYCHGTSTQFTSRAYFSKGTAIAGTAWRYPSQWWAIKIPDFNHDVEQFRLHMQRELKLTARQANLLSKESADIRWIVCFGIVDPSGNFRGVLSIDSVYEDSLQKINPDSLTACANLLGAILYAHDNSKAE
jgi:hypothetical protein